MQLQCDDIWRQVDQLNFRFDDELTSRPRRRDDQGDELTCNPWTPSPLAVSNTLPLPIKHLAPHLLDTSHSYNNKNDFAIHDDS